VEDKTEKKLVITWKQVKEGQPALMRVLNSPLEIKLAYRVKKIANQLTTEIKNIENARMELIQKWGEEVEEKGVKHTGTFRVLPKNSDTFKKEYDKMLEKEVETNIAKIPAECLTTLRISPLELIAIEMFLEEPKV